MCTRKPTNTATHLPPLSESKQGPLAQFKLNIDRHQDFFAVNQELNKPKLQRCSSASKKVQNKMWMPLFKTSHSINSKQYLPVPAVHFRVTPLMVRLTIFAASWYFVTTSELRRSVMTSASTSSSDKVSSSDIFVLFCSQATTLQAFIVSCRKSGAKLQILNSAKNIILGLLFGNDS